jgi:hypothetical protein
MRKITKEITFEGINQQIREAIIEQLQIKEAKNEFLDDLCEENNIRLFLQIGDCYENECIVGYDDDETSENICDAILEMYENTSLIDEEIYENPISIDLIDDYGDCCPVCILDLKEYTSLTIVDKYGDETNINDDDFLDCIVSAVDISLNNNNLQHTKIYKDIFGDENTEDMNDDEYNNKYNDLISNILKSVKKYMLCESGQQFNFRPTKRFVSGYFAFSIPDVRDAYNEDICDVLYYEDR